MSRVIANVRDGKPLKTAALLAGISEDTLSNWRREDEKFAALLEEAIADSEAALIARVQEAAKDDWRAAAFLLERRHHENWGKKTGEVQHNHLHVQGQELLQQLAERRREYDARRAQAITVEATPVGGE